MSEFWNGSGYGGTDESSDEDAADEVLSDIEGAAEDFEDEEEDEKLENDVRRRLEVASLYRVLLADSLFNENTEAAKHVTKKVRRFVTDELKRLLGMAPAAAAPENALAQAFSPQQIDVLQRLASLSEPRLDALLRIADKVLEKSNSPAPLQTPSPVPRTAPAPLPAPTLRKRAAPEPAKVVTSPPTPPAAPKAKSQAPAAKEVAAKKKQPGKPKVAGTIKLVNPDAQPGEKKVFRKETVKSGRIVQEYVDEQGAPIARGAVRDATPQVRPPDAIPMPSPDMVGRHMEILSTAAVEKSGEKLGEIMTPNRNISLI